MESSTLETPDVVEEPGLRDVLSSVAGGEWTHETFQSIRKAAYQNGAASRSELDGIVADWASQSGSFGVSGAQAKVMGGFLQLTAGSLGDALKSLKGTGGDGPEGKWGDLFYARALLGAGLFAEAAKAASGKGGELAYVEVDALCRQKEEA
ncbi:MAG: hypothetical protein AAF488_19740, partial [Planctomycetota bacterium]